MRAYIALGKMMGNVFKLGDRSFLRVGGAVVSGGRGPYKNFELKGGDHISKIRRLRGKVFQKKKFLFLFCNFAEISNSTSKMTKST